MNIRIATLEDAFAIQNIYRYYVDNTAITFELEVPSVKEFQERITKTLERYPYLVACLLYTSPSPRDMRRSRMPSSA